ncbi:sensor histidine kinase [Flavobacterium sp.]
MENRWKRHLLFWIAYLAFEVYADYVWMSITYKQLSSWELFGMCFIPEIILVLVIKIPLVYSSFYFLRLFSIDKPNNFKLISLMTGVVLLFTVMAQLIDSYVFNPFIYSRIDILPSGDFRIFLNSFMDKIFVVGIAIALKLYFESQRLLQREHLLVKEKIETELNFLKSQINPHFLFNTLNNIYSLARKKSDTTADVVLKLSKLLRFVLYESQNKKIAVEREIHFINDYIELEKIRYDERLQVTFNHSIDNPGSEIAPLLLIPFVENAFKHGASETTSKAFVIIDLKLAQGKLDFSISNSIENDLATSKDNEGIGLRNLRRQLEILYPDFDLKINRGETEYKAELSLNLYASA